MKIVICGLTISSAWGNGHATLWRALCRALGRRGHEIVFFERDVPYYAQHRDLSKPAGCELVLYDEWDDVEARVARELTDADVGMTTSYCPDAADASRLLLDSRVRVKAFYDLDTPVTLQRLERGFAVEYLPPNGLGDFDLVLSYTGGRALAGLRERLGARTVTTLYGSVDPEQHCPVAPAASMRSEMSYLGTYSADRQEALQTLFVESARRRPDLRFLLAGSQYPNDFPWTHNISYMPHLTPAEHPAFYCSSGVTLNVTRGPMVDMGFCPSGRFFEAAACGAPLVSDWWEGLDEFFAPGQEIWIASTTDEAVAVLDATDDERRRVGKAARERVLDCHTADHRAADLERAIAMASIARMEVY